jgi:hypothetical protein
MRTISLFIISFFFSSMIFAQQKETNAFVIANGQMPNMTKDKNNTIHIVYGNGDSIMYISSKDGKRFGPPSLIDVLPKLFASAMRGPQIAAGANGITITACTKEGNIFSYNKNTSGKWGKAVKVNDQNENAKEALMSLSADGSNVFAVWLGVKNPTGQDIIGARSLNGGKTWSKNTLVYGSPDNSVCECCKPSVVMKGNSVYVMFRNWLKGNRDLYLITSSDGGKTFGQAQKLGNGSWKLKGCPMDGGGIAVNNNNIAQTVWRREGKIYSATPGMPEKEIGEGRSCTVESINGRNVFAWTEKGDVIVMKAQGIKKNLGKGSLPLIKALNNDSVLCVWENEKQIHAEVIVL